MKFLALISFLFLSSVAIARPSAHRNHNESWQNAYARFLKIHPKSLRDKNAQEAAVKIDELDANAVTEWNDLNIFSQVRDERFLETDEDADFLRRISWLYPDDGCFARAGLMVNLFRKSNLPDPTKVFIFGDLQVKTDNSPDGSVSWWYHVAPAVRVNNEVMVLDAAIEPNNPLPLKEWVGRQTENVMSVNLAYCKTDAYSPADSCLTPDGKDAADAEKDQLHYLKYEWKRQVKLGREPTEVLGDNPPWKK
jgi:hypothetical protein